MSHHVLTITIMPCPPALPWVQLKLDEARAVQEMEARMAAAAAQRADQAAGAPPPAPPPGRTVSNLQLEVQAEQALADEQEGEAGTAQTLLELCSRENGGLARLLLFWMCIQRGGFPGKQVAEQAAPAGHWRQHTVRLLGIAWSA